MKRRRLFGKPVTIPVEEEDDHVIVPVHAEATEESTRMDIDGECVQNINTRGTALENMRRRRSIGRVRTRGGRQARISGTNAHGSDVEGTSRQTQRQNLDPDSNANNIENELEGIVQPSAKEVTDSQEGIMGGEQVREIDVQSAVDMTHEQIGDNGQSVQSNDGHVGNADGRCDVVSNAEIESPPVNVQSMQSADGGQGNVDIEADIDSVPGEGNVINEDVSANRSGVKRTRKKAIMSREFDGKEISTRMSPLVLQQTITALNDEHKTAVRDIGFKSLLHFNVSELPRKFAHWLVNSFDPTRCALRLNCGYVVVKRKHVHRILKFPRGEKQLHIHGKVDNKNEFIKNGGQKLGLKRDKLLHLRWLKMLSCKIKKVDSGSE